MRLTKLFIGLAVLASSAGLAYAQTSLGVGTAEPGLPAGGSSFALLNMINLWQQDFYHALTGALKAMREDPAKLWLLVGLSFAYGVFHAAGPGHGKAVISSYMLANEVALRRGILISLVSAFLQGAVAIALVVAAWLVLRGTSISLSHATHWLEVASFVLIIVFGLSLLWRKLRPMVRDGGWPAGTTAGAHHDHRHRHAHEHEHRHDHAEAEVCATCGHVHMPDPAMLKRPDFRLADAWSAILAVGLRPCSGALLVLTFSLLNGLYVGGVLSVLAMSLGTAITVSALASLAVGAKGAAVHFAGQGSRLAFRIGHSIEIGGAALVTVLGVVLLAAALSGPPFGG